VGLAAVLIAIAAILHNNQLNALFEQNEAALTAAGVQHAHMSKFIYLNCLLVVSLVRLHLLRLYLLTVN
jgi:hypothetical protein